MCRSIKTLRPPVTEQVGDADIHAAALQYVRKVSGFHHPAAHNQAVFDEAVEAVAQATEHLLAHLVVRGSGSRSGAGSGSGARSRTAAG
ncbi:DUF2277 domain-containing protein [Streptomyces pathocidini]|uniref:DUF2277 domain-containing protein n=1 Tax=Streptomyces pathocidini TaxID=1650571 RepID=UPI00340809EB